MPKRHFFDIIQDPAEKKNKNTSQPTSLTVSIFCSEQTTTFEANNFEADFVMVGTNVLRVDRGKPPVGSVPA